MGVALINDYFSGVACLNFLGSYVVQYQIDICEDIELNLYKYTCIYLYIHIHYNFIFWKWFINEPRQSQLNEFASWLRWVLDLAVGVTKMHKWLEKYCHFVCTRGPPTFQPHGPGQLDLLYQIAAAGRSETNACRNLHSLIHKRGLTLPLKIHTVEVPVRKRKPKVRKTWVHYPVILPSTWAKYLLESHSFLLLGGHDINHGTWQRELAMFWETYLKTDANHPMVKPGAPPPERTVPLYIHGDEGRGKYRLPIMIQAIQAVVSFKGPAFKNSSGQLISKSVFPHVICACRALLIAQGGLSQVRQCVLRHTMCTRFLYTVLPSELYWGDETLTHINRFFAENLLELFENGILVSWLHYDIAHGMYIIFRLHNFGGTPTWLQVETRGGQEQVYFCVLGVKGDWPHLRKVPWVWV